MSDLPCWPWGTPPAPLLISVANVWPLLRAPALGLSTMPPRVMHSNIIIPHTLTNQFFKKVLPIFLTILHHIDLLCCANV